MKQHSEMGLHDSAIKLTICAAGDILAHGDLLTASCKPAWIIEALVVSSVDVITPLPKRAMPLDK